jgi:hypothetical protein
MHRDFAGGMIHGSAAWPEREPGPEQGSVLYGLAATVHLPSMQVRCGQTVRLVSHMPAVCGSRRVLQRANAPLPPTCSVTTATVVPDFAAFCAALTGRAWIRSSSMLSWPQDRMLPKACKARRVSVYIGLQQHPLEPQPPFCCLIPTRRMLAPTILC